jgi:hypothetical protein
LKSKLLVLLVCCKAESKYFSCSFKDILEPVVAKSYVSKPNLDMELLVATLFASDAAVPYSLASILVVPSGFSSSWTLDPSEQAPMHSNYYSYAY